VGLEGGHDDGRGVAPRHSCRRGADGREGSFAGDCGRRRPGLNVTRPSAAGPAAASPPAPAAKPAPSAAGLVSPRADPPAPG
jgi:hypothetical protein